MAEIPKEKIKEGFSWLKWIQGIFNPLTAAKSSAHIIQIVLLIALIFFCAKAGVWVKNWLFPRSAPAPVEIQSNSGHIETQPDKRQKIGVINF